MSTAARLHAIKNKKSLIQTQSHVPLPSKPERENLSHPRRQINKIIPSKKGSPVYPKMPCGKDDEILNFENIMNVLERDYTPQSYFTISAWDSFESHSRDSGLGLGEENKSKSTSGLDTPPYPRVRYSSGLLLSTPCVSQKTPMN